MKPYPLKGDVRSLFVFALAMILLKVPTGDLWGPLKAVFELYRADEEFVISKPTIQSVVSYFL